MIETFVRTMLLVAGVYAGLGLLFAAAFHAVGVHRVDAGTKDAGWFFRLLVTPGIVTLWPWLALRWRAAARGRQVLGARERPLTASGLRSLHRNLARLLLLVVPLLAAVGIALRPGRPVELQGLSALDSAPPPLATIVAVVEAPFPDLPIELRLLEEGGRYQVELEVSRDLEIPALLLYEGDSHSEPKSLGPVFGPGTRRFFVSGPDAVLSLHSAAWNEKLGGIRLADLE